MIGQPTQPGAGQRRGAQFTAAALLSLSLAGWLGWCADGWLTQPYYRTAWLCGPLLGVVVLVPQLWRAMRGDYDLFAPTSIFTLYLFIQQGLWTAYMMTTGTTHMRATAASYAPELPAVLLMASGALFLFQLPSWMPPPRRSSHPVRVWKPGRLKMLAVLLPLLAAVLFFIFTRDVGGLSAYLAQLGSNRSTQTAGQWGFLLIGESLLTFGSCAALIIYRIGRAYRYLALAAFAASAGVLIGLLAGFRILSLVPLATSLAMYHYFVRRFRVRVLGLVAILIVATLSSVYSTLRDHPELGSQGAAELLLQSVTTTRGYQASLEATLTRLQGSETVATVLAETGPTGGYQWGWRALAQAPALLIPRAIWPESPFKLFPESVRFGTNFFGSAFGTLQAVGGFSPTWEGEVYWNFGLPGVLVLSFLLGYCCRWLYFSALHPVDGYWLVALAYLPLCLVLLAEAPTDALTGIMLFAGPMVALRGWLCPSVAGVGEEHTAVAPMLPGRALA